MRPNLSPLEYGAYGTPSRVVSVEVAGPQPSADGRAETISASDIGAIFARQLCMCRAIAVPSGV